MPTTLELGDHQVAHLAGHRVDVRVGRDLGQRRQRGVAVPATFAGHADPLEERALVGPRRAPTGATGGELGPTSVMRDSTPNRSSSSCRSSIRRRLVEVAVKAHVRATPQHPDTHTSR